VAVLINTARVYSIEALAPMVEQKLFRKSTPAERWAQAAHELERILVAARWKVKSLKRDRAFEEDLLLRRSKVAYAVELKAASEGRSDRLIPLFSQAALQVSCNPTKNVLRLAVVSAPKVTRRAADQVLEFAAKYAPDLAVGVFDFQGLACSTDRISRTSTQSRARRHRFRVPDRHASGATSSRI
jgi:hypothetical protein